MNFGGIRRLFDLLFRKNGHSGPMVDRELPSVLIPEEVAVTVSAGTLKENRQLTKHFSLFELTITTNEKLQKANRLLTDAQVTKLVALAEHAEVIRKICGGLPLAIHSGYRSLELNGATSGSSSTSQHPRCEAIDFHVKGLSCQQVFYNLLQAAKRGEFKFGQLILEKADRPYGTIVWVHCSVIGTLNPSKVGQAMTMSAGGDGKQKYVLVEHLKF